tara:strand:- start:1671 stop:2867 length:1197 start_codon:yes stop_codon:yes gene_type:complete
MARKRLTNRAPTHNNDRRAAQPPASYDWTPEHPAYDQPDPEVDQYLIDNDGNGTGSEPSDFNEDVHPGPYVNSGHPAMPDEGEWHPARKASARKQAFMKRRAAERKAAKCIRIAQSLLGEFASVEAIEDQAVDLMDLPDSQINATLDRLSATFLADQNDPAGDTLAPMDDAVIQAGGYYADEEAEDMLEAMIQEEAMITADIADDDGEVEALLAEMIELEGEEAEAGSYCAEEETMLAEMIEEANEVEANEFCADEVEANEFCADEEIADELMMAEHADIDMLAEDPMGLAEEAEMDDLLAELYAGKFASDEKDADEKEDKKAEENCADEDEKEAEEAEASDEKESSKKKASKQSPKRRKASKGPKSLGTVTKTAASELNELAALWETAPDVSGFFDS